MRVRLLALGYTRVEIFPEGWGLWRESGLPVKKNPGPARRCRPGAPNRIKLASLEPGDGLDLGLTGVMQRWLGRVSVSAGEAGWAAALPEGRARDVVFAALRAEKMPASGG